MKQLLIIFFIYKCNEYIEAKKSKQNVTHKKVKFSEIGNDQAQHRYPTVTK